MSTPRSVEEWDAFMEELAEFRAGRAVDLFPLALGIDDVRSLHEWCQKDAVESLPVIAMTAVSGTPAPAAVGAMLATHTQLGIEIGLYLVASGRVKL